MSELQLAASVRMAGALAEKLFSAPLGLLVLYGLRKEQTPRYGSMFRIHAPVAGRRVFTLGFLLKKFSPGARLAARG